MTAARADERTSGAVYVHAYDDLRVMAGRGTLADEMVLSGHGPFDAIYLQIGGGGMAAAVSNWLKTYWPGIEAVGVEGIGQASMKAALAAGKPVELDEVDIFATARRCAKAGELPFQICRDTLDRRGDGDATPKSARPSGCCGNRCAVSPNLPERWGWRRCSKIAPPWRESVCSSLFPGRISTFCSSDSSPNRRAPPARSADLARSHPGAGGHDAGVIG